MFFMIGLLFAAIPCGLGLLMFVWLIGSMLNAYTDDSWSEWKVPELILLIIEKCPLIGSYLRFAKLNSSKFYTSDVLFGSFLMVCLGVIMGLAWPLTAIVLSVYLLVRSIRFARRMKKYVSKTAKQAHRHTKSGKAAKVEIEDFKF